MNCIALEEDRVGVIQPGCIAAVPRLDAIAVVTSGPTSCATLINVSTGVLVAQTCSFEVTIDNIFYDALWHRLFVSAFDLVRKFDIVFEIIDFDQPKGGAFQILTPVREIDVGVCVRVCGRGGGGGGQVFVFFSASILKHED